MAKRKTAEQVIIDSLEGSRKNNSTFANWTDDTFIGYATGMLNMQHLDIDLSVAGWEMLIRQMLEDGRI